MAVTPKPYFHVAIKTVIAMFRFNYFSLKKPQGCRLLAARSEALQGQNPECQSERTDPLRRH